MCGRKSKSFWLLLVASLCLLQAFSWAEDLTESQVYLLAGEVSAEMKKVGMEAERTKLYQIFMYFSQKFDLLENQSLEWQNLSKTQEEMLTDLQNQLQKASDKVTSLQERLPILESRVSESRTSLENLIEEKRWDSAKGFALGVIVASVLAVVAKLVWK